MHVISDQRDIYTGLNTNLKVYLPCRATASNFCLPYKNFTCPTKMYDFSLKYEKSYLIKIVALPFPCMDVSIVHLTGSKMADCVLDKV